MHARFSPAHVAFYVEAIIENDRYAGDGRDHIELDYERLAGHVEAQASLYMFGPAFARALAEVFRQYARRNAFERAAAYIQARIEG